MIKIGCIADDFTGAGDAASLIKFGGLKTLYVSGDAVSDVSIDDTVEAVVVALKCRSISPSDAVEQVIKVARWLIKSGAEHIYYKYCSTFDSTNRGNIGPITDALMDLMDVEYTLLCPSFPANGRTVKDGILYVNGIKLEDSSMRNHPVNPMTESYIPKLMETQSKYKCMVLNEINFRSLPDLGHLYDCKCTLVPDYESDNDGAIIADCFSGLSLFTGGSGLLEHLSRKYSSESVCTVSSAPLSSSENHGRLLLAGSCSNATLRQIEEYKRTGEKHIRIDPAQLISGKLDLNTLKFEIEKADGDILIYSSDTPENISSQNLDQTTVSSLLESVIGSLAKYGHDIGYTRIIVAGGETSGRVIQELGYKAFEIHESVAPGVPRMTPVNNKNLNLVLKSGNFGDDLFLVNTLK